MSVSVYPRVRVTIKPLILSSENVALPLMGKSASPQVPTVILFHYEERYWELCPLVPSLAHLLPPGEGGLVTQEISELNAHVP